MQQLKLTEKVVDQYLECLKERWDSSKAPVCAEDSIALPWHQLDQALDEVRSPKAEGRWWAPDTVPRDMRGSLDFEWLDMIISHLRWDPSCKPNIHFRDFTDWDVSPFQGVLRHWERNENGAVVVVRFGSHYRVALFDATRVVLWLDGLSEPDPHLEHVSVCDLAFS